MHEYPVFLKLQGKRCLVVGMGGVGRRKAASLLDAGAEEVLMIDAAPADETVEQLAANERARFDQRFFEAKDLDGRFLVFACTSSESVNGEIARLCKERGILCNVADQPALADFIVPASFCRGDLRVAVSTCGGSPALTRHIRKELETYFGEEYAMLLEIMRRLRPEVLALKRETAWNTRLFRELTTSGLLDALQSRDLDKARDILERVLPAELRDNIPELLDGLV